MAEHGHDLAPDSRPEFVAEYELAPIQQIARVDDATWAMSKRVFDAAEDRNLDVTVMRRSANVGDRNDATFRLRVTITVAEPSRVVRAEELNRHAADVISEAFSPELWRIADVRVRTFASMEAARADARNRSLGRDAFVSEEDLVARLGLSPEMARLVTSVPEMRKFFRAEDVDAYLASTKDHGDDSLGR